MKVLVIIPLDLHNSLLSRCEVKSREFNILRNGLIEPNGDSVKCVTVLCDLEQAAKIRDFAQRVHPESVGQIVMRCDDAVT